MMCLIRCFVFLSVACCLPLALPAQGVVSTQKLAGDSAVQVIGAEKSYVENPLFTSEEVLALKLRVNYQELLKDRGEERGYHQGVLSYTDAAGAEVALNLKVMVRGNHRRNPKICGFPPLLLNFSRKTTKGTLFGHVNKVKVVTHCLGENYLFREYLVYKLYNLLTDKSFRVRLCRIEYEDLQSKRKVETEYAFLIEDDKEMARRNKGKIVPKQLAIPMNGTNEMAMAHLAVFQYMIGNTDWSVPYRHNIKLLSLDSLAAPYPVPYDFDYSGIVAPPYAVPPPELGITSVRQRLYRGYDFPDHIYAEVISTFQTRRAAIYKTYTQFPLLDKSSLKKTLDFIDDFYKTIDSPKDFRNKIVKVGQSNQKSYVVVKGLK